MTLDRSRLHQRQEEMARPGLMDGAAVAGDGDIFRLEALLGLLDAIHLDVIANLDRWAARFTVQQHRHWPIAGADNRVRLVAVHPDFNDTAFGVVVIAA